MSARCFHRALGTDGVATHEALPALARTLAERQARHAGRQLHGTSVPRRSGPDGAKVEEEAEEVARAGREESDERLRATRRPTCCTTSASCSRRVGLTYADALEELTPG